MAWLAEDAEPERPIQIDTTTAARMVRPYTWLLNWVGPEGIRLTEAGHLPSAQVTEAMCELNLAADGHGRRENQVRGVRQLRESAQAMGLLRKQRLELLLTVRAGELRVCIRPRCGGIWPSGCRCGRPPRARFSPA